VGKYLVLLLAASFAIGSSVYAKQSTRPNIVFIFSDDHSPEAIGAYQGWLAGVNPTPNIDRLAREGMLFRNSYCTNSICGPSRAVILTGKHSHKNGFMKNGDVFDGGQQTFPKLLRQAGYQTAVIGKWHLGSMPQGFDHWQILPGQGEYYNPQLITEAGTKRIPGYCTDVVTDLAIEWMETASSKETPFLLMCQHKAPHRNWMPAPRHLELYSDVDIPVPDSLFDRWEDNASPAKRQEMGITKDMHPWFDLFLGPNSANATEGASEARDPSGVKNLAVMTPSQKEAWDVAFQSENERFAKEAPTGKARDRWKHQRYIKNYLRCIRGVDDSVGRIMAYLAEKGLDENTIVIYSSDQGFFLGEHGWFDKRWMYEESFCMPLIVKWPGVASPGSVCDRFVQNLDYAETFIVMAGGSPPADMQGRSLLPLLRGQTPIDWRESLYYHYYASDDIHRVARHNGVRTERHKLIHFYETDEWELYDLLEDPDELTNIYPKHSESPLVAKLKQELKRLEHVYQDNTASVKHD
jgi:arylsulfatase A-like enzyme